MSKETLQERLNRVLRLYKETAGYLGREYNEENLVAKNYDLGKIVALVNKPNKARQKQAYEVMVRELTKDPVDPLMAQLGLDDENLLQEEAYIEKLVRRMDAFIKVANAPGNFKAQAVLKEYGEKFYQVVMGAICEGIPPQDVVKLRERGIMDGDEDVIPAEEPKKKVRMGGMRGSKPNRTIGGSEV